MVKTILFILSTLKCQNIESMIEAFVFTSLTVTMPSNASCHHHLPWNPPPLLFSATDTLFFLMSHLFKSNFVSLEKAIFIQFQFG